MAPGPLSFDPILTRDEPNFIGSLPKVVHKELGLYYKDVNKQGLCLPCCTFDYESVKYECARVEAKKTTVLQSTFAEIVWLMSAI